MQATKDWVYVFWRKRQHSLGYASVDTVEQGIKLAVRHYHNRTSTPVAIVGTNYGFVAYDQAQLLKEVARRENGVKK